MPRPTLYFLAEFSLDHGLIGIDEYFERIQIAKWLFTEDPNTMDPRHPSDSDFENKIAPEYQAEGFSIQAGFATEAVEDHEFLHLVLAGLNGTWHFTGSDPDPYPSVPHGHLQNANRAWPKLNPYTGRVFKGKHQEEASLRLSKSQMQILWRDSRFRIFCKSQVIEYLQRFPYHKFPTKHHLRLPRW